jgi:hypothetical protein
MYIVVNSDFGPKSYEVTSTENRFNGYVVPSGIGFYTRVDEDYYVPTAQRTEFVINKATPKPSIYKGWYGCRSKYDYAFSEKETKTTTTERDVYYNQRRDKFITRKNNTRVSTKTEYSFPHSIVW